MWAAEVPGVVSWEQPSGSPAPDPGRASNQRPYLKPEVGMTSGKLLEEGPQQTWLLLLLWDGSTRDGNDQRLRSSKVVKGHFACIPSSYSDAFPFPLSRDVHPFSVTLEENLGRERADC